MGLILIKQDRSNNRWVGVMTTARQGKKKKKEKGTNAWRLTQVSADGGSCIERMTG